MFGVLLILALFNFSYTANLPNVVTFLFDDLGWSDISITNQNQIQTPSIDSVALHGITLKNHITQPCCTPSRAALLTGKQPLTQSLQGLPLLPGEKKALPLQTKILPEYLRDRGYETHLVGKWHLGCSNKNYLPFKRGFSSWFGYCWGWIGYFDHKISDNVLNMTGLDFYRNGKPALGYDGKYVTDIFRDESLKIIKRHDPRKPLFLMISELAGHTGANGTELGNVDPQLVDEMFSFIEDPRRRQLAGTILAVDETVKQVISALSKKKMLENTIVMFLSDNGAQTNGTYENFGSNYPLRGQKLANYQGGIRTPAGLWYKGLANKKSIYDEIFHITDWTPTILGAIGEDVSRYDFDGINHWPSLANDVPVERKQPICINWDDKNKYGAVMSSDGRWKLIKGDFNFGVYSNYTGDTAREGAPPYNYDAVINNPVSSAIENTGDDPLTEDVILSTRSQMEIDQADVARKPINCTQECLFDLWNDPTETTDVKDNWPDIYEELLTEMEECIHRTVPQGSRLQDPKSDPSCCKNIWYPWEDIFKPLYCGLRKLTNPNCVRKVM